MMKYVLDADEICCRSMTASCMACSQKKTIAEYCDAEENKEVVGCKGSDVCHEYFLQFITKYNPQVF